MIRYFEERDDIKSTKAIEKWLTTQVASFNQSYGKRAYTAINTMGVSALIYIKQDDEDFGFDDPIVKKMQSFAQFLRDRNLNFLTIVGKQSDNIFK